MDILEYTDKEIIKNFALLENHLKQAQSGVDEIFCEDCINKHLILIEGLAEEGMNIGNNFEKYKGVYDFAVKTKDKDYRREGVKLSDEARKIRKSLNFCPECDLTKDLNNQTTSNNYTHNSDSHINDYPKLNGEPRNNMAKMAIGYAELGLMNVGQFAAEGIRYLAETQFPTQEKYVTIGGGIALQALALFVKMPKMIKTFTLVTGSNLLAAGVVKLIKGTTTPLGARAGVVRVGNAGNAGNRAGNFTGRPNGRVFGGPVTATNIPTQYARSTILASSQAFESPEHADLIRVD